MNPEDVNESSQEQETPPEETPPEETTPPPEENKEVEEDTPPEEKEAEPQLELDLETLQFPDGFEKNDELMDSFSSILSDSEKSVQERAQALIDLHVSTMQEASERVSQQWQDVRSEWVKQSQALPEIGGSNLEATLGGISEVVDRFGPTVKDDNGNTVNEFRRVMDESGLGDHPVMIQFLNGVAKELREGHPVGGTPATEKPSKVESFYPSMAKKE